MIESTTVVGAGHCGRQIAYLLAKGGIAVTCYEPTDELLDHAKHSFSKSFGAQFLNFKPILFEDSLASPPRCAVLRPQYFFSTNIEWTTNVSIASRNQLIIEAVPETLALKRSVMEPFARHSSPETILVTNSSYLLPSSIFRGFPNPERFAALHFHVPPWFATAVDVMPTSRTAPEVLAKLVQLVHRIGLDPILLRREFPGYVFNNLLNPLLVKAMELADRQVCSPAEIERSWQLITQMPVGPFGMMLQIGLPSLRTILDSAVTQINDPSTQRAHRFIHQWDGSFDETKVSDATAEFVYSTLQGRDSLSNQRSPSPSLFVPYELVWAESETYVSTQDEIVGRLREAVRSGSLLKSIEQLATDQIFLWPLSFPEYEANIVERLSLSMTDPSEELIQQILSLKKWQQAQIESGSHKPAWFVSFRNTSRNSSAVWNGSAGMIRSLWLEQKAQQQVKMMQQNSMDSFPSVHLLEVDLNSIPKTPRHPTPEKSLRSSPAESVGEGNLVHAFAHLHQRFEAGTWRRPKLRPLPLPKNWVPAKQLLENSHWIVSGGGRGITAQLAMLLGIHGAQLELLGRTPLPSKAWHERSEAEIKEAREAIIRDAAARRVSIPVAQSSFDSEVELSRNLYAFTSLGVSFRYHQIDIANRDQLWNLYDTFFEQGKSVDGILHGAGFEQTTLLWKKSIDSIRKTIDSKVRGSLNLQSLVGKETRWFIQCGSLAGFFGGIGQVDYAAANSFQGDQAQQIKEQWPQVQSITIAWPGWEEVGMAARSSSKWSLEKAGHKLMPLDEGRRHFMTLLEKQISGLVLICNPEEIPQIFLEKIVC